VNVVIPRPRGGEDVPGLGKVCIVLLTFILTSYSVFHLFTSILSNVYPLTIWQQLCLVLYQ
jgi:hypothetical protein